MNPNAESKKFHEVQNLIILDRSGSMMSISEQAVAGVNETINTIRQSQKEHEDLKQRLTVVSFCGCSVKTFCYNSPIDEVGTMTMRDYVPCCSTPLYDTMGEALTRMRKEVGGRKDVAVSITIITDGYENASRKWTGPQIKAMIELLKADGWLFAFIGANQDIEEIKFSLSIDNAMAFKADKEGTAAMFKKERMARKMWHGRVACMKSDAPECSSINEDYFD